MYIDLNELKDKTKLVIPLTLDLNKPLKICEVGEGTDSDSLLFITPLSGGEKREVKVTSPPYAIITDFADERTFGDIPVIKAESTRECLSIAYSLSYKIEYNTIKIIGVTGTSGKSTTAEMIFGVLSYNNLKVGLIGTGIIKTNERIYTDRYYSMTTPDPKDLYRYISQMQKEGCQYIVMEVSSHSIALGKVSPIPFEVGIFTNLSEEHRDFHKDMKEYQMVKARLFNMAKYGIFNIDDEWVKEVYEKAECDKCGVGIMWHGDVYATDICQRGLKGSSFYYREEGLIFGVDLKLPGAFNIYNSLFAIKCCIHLGIKPTLVKQAINFIDGVRGRMECIYDELTVVIDYAHTPLALQSLLKALNSSKNARQKITTVFGCGGERDKEKRPQMGKIARELSDNVIITEDNNRGESFDEIAGQILCGIEERDSVSVITDRALAIRYAIMSAEKNDIIAVVGKGHEEYIIDGSGIHPFDERGVITEALRDRKNAN